MSISYMSIPYPIRITLLIVILLAAIGWYAQQLAEKYSLDLPPAPLFFVACIPLFIILGCVLN